MMIYVMLSWLLHIGVQTKYIAIQPNGFDREDCVIRPFEDCSGSKCPGFSLFRRIQQETLSKPPRLLFGTSDEQGIAPEF